MVLFIYPNLLKHLQILYFRFIRKLNFMYNQNTFFILCIPDLFTNAYYTCVDSEKNVNTLIINIALNIPL